MGVLLISGIQRFLSICLSNVCDQPALTLALLPFNEQQARELRTPICSHQRLCTWSGISHVYRQGEEESPVVKPSAVWMVPAI